MTVSGETQPGESNKRGGLLHTLLLILLANVCVLGVAYLVIPDRIIWGFEKLWLSIKGYDVEEAFVYLGILAGCLVVECFALGWEGCALHKLLKPSKSARTDLVVGGLQYLGMGIVTVAIFFTFGSAYVIPQFIRKLFGYNLVHAIDSTLLQFLIYLVVYDFVEYWYHRWCHKVEFLWEAHKYHHSATEFTMLTGNRIHPLEMGIGLIVTSLPMAIMGARIEAYFAVICFRRVIDIFQHSMVDWRYGWIGKWLIYSPVGHRIHHSALEEHHDKNFGNFFPFWDRLFGTWYGGEVINSEVDVKNNQYNQDTVVGDLFLSYRLFLKSLWRSMRTGKWRVKEESKEGLIESADSPVSVPESTQ